MLLLGKIMILQGVGHPISCLGVCYANDPKKGGYMTPAHHTSPHPTPPRPATHTMGGAFAHRNLDRQYFGHNGQDSRAIYCSPLPRWTPSTPRPPPPAPCDTDACTRRVLCGAEQWCKAKVKRKTLLSDVSSAPFTAADRPTKAMECRSTAGPKN